ncbi:cell wall metabolism sensor histidine kinase WalK [Micromonospora sp. ATCC 39149]|uniref:histidine kinase n=1 Tax=Micromonospora carbonacea TaxID=47853 RepID=A0A7D6CG62_9ACTN|nr:HAMP domain-containing sensor histidine kinase [Micromonospora sp. ATCC 39149]QLK00677.1 HAMP domain-containing histidine kinase [Micromonospora carbonacea]
MKPPAIRSRLTIRVKLTLLYAGLFALSGAALLTLTYLLVRWQLARPGATPLPEDLERATAGGGSDVIVDIEEAVQADVLATALWQSAVAFAAMAAATLVLGWFTAGQAVRPVRDIATLASRLSADSLGARIGYTGARDELAELAYTFDAMLDRLQRAFDAQRLFVANASHELRTPLAVIGAAVDVTLARPAASIEDYRSALRRIERAAGRCEQLTTSLLQLARTQHGLGQRHLVDVAALVDAHLQPLSGGELHVQARLTAVSVEGDPVLLQLLVRNVVENAARHNTPNGHVEVELTSDDGVAVLVVENSGPEVPAADLPRLRTAFHRAGGRTAATGGHGLGLAIVDAVASAHAGALTLTPGRAGGLRVEVRVPVYAGESGQATCRPPAYPLGR